MNGQIKYVGTLKEDTSDQTWLGIELTRPVGRHSGRGYFNCGKQCGLFLKESSLCAAEATAPVPLEGVSSTPAPFSIICYDEERDSFINYSADGKQQLSAVEPTAVTRYWAMEYVQALVRSGKFDCRIWPYHCLVGSPGAAVVPELLDAFERWTAVHQKPVGYVLKGHNIRTEMYSAVKAEVVDPNDASTALNVELIDRVRGCMRRGCIHVAGAHRVGAHLTTSGIPRGVVQRRSGSIVCSYSHARLCVLSSDPAEGWRHCVYG